MGWVESQGRDLSHHNTVGDYDAARGAMNWVQLKITESDNFIDSSAARLSASGTTVIGPGPHHRGFAGIPRGAYHFAQPGSLVNQIRHFLNVKAAIGPWERVDMLDCEFAGVDGGFIRALKEEYRRQSGQQKLLIYLGLYEVTHACAPDLWWDPDVYMWVARYRKIGAPSGPDAWRSHLGFDHPGLSTYQWDNATPLPGANLTDISYERVAVTATQETGMVELTGTSLAWQEDILRRVQQLTLNGGQPLEGDPTSWRAGGDFTKLQQAIVGTADVGLVKTVNDLATELAQVKALLTQLVGSGVKIGATGAITVGVQPSQ